jgi:hypothetical protein
MGKQISVKCDQMPHCGAYIFVVKDLKVICPSPQQVLFLRMQDGAQFNYPRGPLGDCVDQIPLGRETKIDQMPLVSNSFLFDSVIRELACQ